MKTSSDIRGELLADEPYLLAETQTLADAERAVLEAWLDCWETDHASNDCGCLEIDNDTECDACRTRYMTLITRTNEWQRARKQMEIE